MLQDKGSDPHIVGGDGSALLAQLSIQSGVVVGCLIVGVRAHSCGRWPGMQECRVSPRHLCRTRRSLAKDRLSIASVWEILIKVQSGKLNLPRPVGPYVLKKLVENGIEMLPISVDHLLALERLPMHHRDPFDRMLIVRACGKMSRSSHPIRCLSAIPSKSFGRTPPGLAQNPILSSALGP
jgi:PIN domain nuclease of toxin-antitoxin system